MVGTCNELLKWKFAHLNSVDFLLRTAVNGGELLATPSSSQPVGRPYTQNFADCRKAAGSAGGQAEPRWRAGALCSIGR